MKQTLHRLIILNIIVFSALFSKAQLTTDAQLRNRFEVRNGYKTLAKKGQTPAAFISQRTRLSLTYETDLLKLKVTPQDVRVWGDEDLSSSTGVFGDYASFALFEGYAELKLKQLGWLSIGRQQLVYDNQRLLAARNWNQNGMAYDALVLKMNLNEINIHAGTSWNSISEVNQDNYYYNDRIKSMSYLWLNKSISNQLTLSFLHLSSGITPNDTTNTLNFRHTTGLYATYTNKNLKGWANIYYQYGKNTSNKSVSAFLADAEISYKTGNLTTGLYLGYLSGNSKISSEITTDHLFDVLYGARHKYFGMIDYYGSFSSHTKQGGLVDYSLFLDIKLSKSTSIRNTGHYFQLAQTNASTPSDKNLGYENDLLLKHQINKWSSIESGYSFYLPTESLKTLRGISNNEFSNYFYLMITITPTLLTK